MPEPKPQWFIEYEEGEDERLSKFATKVEIKKLVSEALEDSYKGYGKKGKALLISVAVIITSLTAILGGLKIMLGWIGFNYISK